MPTATLNKPTPAQVRNTILTVMEVTHPAPQSHADVARKLRWLAPPHRIAMNMDRLARDGVLVAEDGNPEKRYKIAV